MNTIDVGSTLDDARWSAYQKLLVGNGVAAIVIGRRCGQLDAARLAERIGVRRSIQPPSRGRPPGI
jgi:hypothetical protein